MYGMVKINDNKSKNNRSIQCKKQSHQHNQRRSNQNKYSSALFFSSAPHSRDKQKFNPFSIGKDSIPPSFAFFRLLSTSLVSYRWTNQMITILGAKSIKLTHNFIKFRFKQREEELLLFGFKTNSTHTAIVSNSALLEAHHEHATMPCVCRPFYWNLSRDYTLAAFEPT